MSVIRSSSRIRKVHGELDNIVDDLNLAARLPQALLDRLKTMRGILLAELNNPGETDSNVDLLSGELSQDAKEEHYGMPKIIH